MGVKIKFIKKGEIHPAGNGIFASGYTKEQATRLLMEMPSSKAKTKEKYLSGVPAGGHKVYDDAWITTWEDEPEENEFGRICP